jgi:hypothetical protein
LGGGAGRGDPNRTRAKVRSSGQSEAVESEDGDVVGLTEALRLLGDALSGLGADLRSTFETEELAGGAFEDMRSKKCLPDFPGDFLGKAIVGTL